MAALEIPGIFKFEITVDEVMQTVQAILTETKQAKVRAALRVMISELKKGNRTLVREVLAPLCTINSRQEFDQKFPQLHQSFKDIFLGSRPILAEMNCYKVTEKLTALKKSQQWKKRIGFSRSVMRLEILVDQWIANDSVLYHADRDMIGEINNFLDDIAATQNRSAAYKKFRAGIARIEDRFVAIRDQLSQLETLNAKI